MGKCKKLVFKDFNSETPTILLGLIISDKENRIEFKTSKRTWLIDKSRLISLSDTDREFEEWYNYINYKGLREHINKQRI